MRLAVILIVILLSLFGYSQTKTEYERSIALDSFPEAAKTSLMVLPSGVNKQRFYKEISGGKISYETKFRYHKKYYSIEFSANGILEDIEITVNLKLINPDLKVIMEKHFEATSKKYRWLKIQEQYRYEIAQNAELFILDVLSGNSKLQPFYEIIAEVKNNRSFTLKEYNFNNLGELVSEKTIDPESYAHVLY